EEKRIREFYQSRGLDRVTQPSGEGGRGDGGRGGSVVGVVAPVPVPDPPGCPFSSFHSSSKDKSKAVLQQKYVRCSVRAQIRHLRRVLCHRLGLPLQHVQILFSGEVLPDHMTMKQLWLSRWFGKPAPLLLHYSIKDKRR
ncbi:PCGF1 protein, partial [Alectura lathami]|nr:PCGF1 protein [Alectura lathami]